MQITIRKTRIFLWLINSHDVQVQINQGLPKEDISLDDNHSLKLLICQYLKEI
jgi:hypothetical protein